MSKLGANDAYATVARLLFELRREKGVSQVELAARLGKVQTFISYIERRERRVDVVEFYAITRALRIEPEEAFGRLVQALSEKGEI